MSNGIDIKAAKGEKVFSVAPGRVDYIGWMRGYGKFIIINHFGGYLTVYAHLEKISVVESQDLNFGDEIGLTGETGSLNGIKLHFQIRHESETVDPREWLEKKE
jgi:septal ring factor EnvC (AmiA/AmiB activator)